MNRKVILVLGLIGVGYLWLTGCCTMQGKGQGDGGGGKRVESAPKQMTAADTLGPKIKLGDIGEIGKCAQGMGQGASWSCEDDQANKHSCIKITCSDASCEYGSTNVCYTD